jgi:hypothetical protein
VYLPAAPAHVYMPWPSAWNARDAEIGHGITRGRQSQPTVAKREAESMAKRAVAKKGGKARVTRRRGRSVVALTLFGFVLVATSVIWRRSFGHSQSRLVQQLERLRMDLRAQRAQLERDIREAASRDKLTPLVEQRLGLRMPSDSQVIVIERNDASPPVRNAAK